MIYKLIKKYNGKSANFNFTYESLFAAVDIELYGAFDFFNFKKENTQVNINIKPPETAYIYLFDGVNTLEIEIENCK